MKPRIFVDMDGTLVEWGNCENEEYLLPGYYKYRPLIESMRDAIIEFIKKGYEVYILSAYPTEEAVTSKNYSLDTIIGRDILPLNHRIFVPYGENKADYTIQFNGGLNVLIDDYNPNLEMWNGIAIKFFNGVNGFSKEWEGHTISRHMTGKEIVKRVQDICDMYNFASFEAKLNDYQLKVLQKQIKPQISKNKKRGLGYDL